MMNFRSFTLASLFLLLIQPGFSQSTDDWKIFDLNDPDAIGELLSGETISASVIEVKKKKKQTLTASNTDRVMFINQGRATITSKDTTVSVAASDVVFLKANLETEIKAGEDLSAMIWTSGSTRIDHEEKFTKFTLEEITEHRKPDENVWHPFVNTPTLMCGLYMLPKSLGGDSTLVHRVDEINYVTRGTAKFKMNEKVIDVAPGSVMWVRKSIGHYFYDLSEDFDVYIMFEKRSVEENNEN